MAVFSEEIHDLLSVGGLKIIQTEGVLRLTLDAFLLADFIHPGKRVKQIMDLGTGLAPIPLILSLKTQAKIVAIDIQEQLVTLAQKSVALNHLTDQIVIMKDDIRVVHSHYPPASFDIVTCNPPFFRPHEQSQMSEAEAVRMAKHEITIDFPTIAKQAKRLLKNRGSFYFIHRAERFEEVCRMLEKECFKLKRIRFVHSRPNQSAISVLIEAASMSPPGGLTVMEPLYIYDRTGAYTEEVLAIFRQKSGENDVEKDALPR
ncbi:MAG: methyltransferase [Candidatus Izemoplasmatales bacterium]